jgi:hypothetical protein
MQNYREFPLQNRPANRPCHSQSRRNVFSERIVRSYLGDRPSQQCLPGKAKERRGCPILDGSLQPDQQALAQGMCGKLRVGEVIRALTTPQHAGFVNEKVCADLTRNHVAHGLTTAFPGRGHQAQRGTWRGRDLKDEAVQQAREEFSHRYAWRQPIVAKVSRETQLPLRHAVLTSCIGYTRALPIPRPSQATAQICDRLPLPARALFAGHRGPSSPIRRRSCGGARPERQRQRRREEARVSTG